MGGGEKKEEKYGASQSWWASIWLSVYIYIKWFRAGAEGWPPAVSDTPTASWGNNSVNFNLRQKSPLTFSFKG
jgi:hypothetical protein